MKKEIGLWIDQHKAVIVILTVKGEEVRRIESEVKGLDRFALDPASNSASKQIRRERLETCLAGYYKRVFTIIRTAKSILIFGPGEAKNRLEEQMKGAGLEEHIVDIQTDGEMTDRQITAKVNRYFSNNRRSYLLNEIPDPYAENR